ncbi:GntR family transcriptional regulator [Bacillus mobilis]
MSSRARWGTYQQLADALRVQLADAADGDPVPSESVLGAEHGVSRTLARRALAVLEDEGVVRVEPGRGRVVGGGPPASPLHVEIASRIRERIREGVYPPGAALPSEHALADSEGVSRGTARMAFRVLEAEGLVVASQGRGRVVAGG